MFLKHNYAKNGPVLAVMTLALANCAMPQTNKKNLARTPFNTSAATTDSSIASAATSTASSTGGSSSSTDSSTSTASSTGGSSSATVSATSGATSAEGTTAVPTSFYVSTTGKDTNSGTSPSAAFASFTAAQAAMQASSSIKTTYIMGGTYTMTATLQLTSKDAGESWLGYQGQTAILDGSGTVPTAISVNGDNITIRWLTIQNFTQNGITLISLKNPVVDSNTILNITSPAWSQAAIYGQWVVNGSITRNIVKHTNYAGIQILAVENQSINNLLIDSNAVYDTCKEVSDCGAIYLMDRSHSSTGMTISNNFVETFGPTTKLAHGIYLDDLTSNTTITRNIITGGGGSSSIELHSGDHNVLQNNIFDISATQNLGLYAADYTSYRMMGNVFTCNIVFSSRQPPVQLWTNVPLANTVGPWVHDNFYWGSQGSLPNVGDILDVSPVVVNPNFVDPGIFNYSFSSAPPSNQSCTFTPINVATIGPLAH